MLKFKANYMATQARFQQKQLQEKEQKLLQLYDQQQQRAYQVVQRGSAGSNGSHHGSTIRTSTTTHHTTSTSQGGKVRQMFDERRQTTVKGIDRSYPLEPLENKLRKQTTNTNGLATQRNGNLTVNRQSVNVKRVARADVNSNVHGGKPVVSYREEVTRESFGPSVHRHDDEDEFGNENRVAATFANGHHRHDLDNEDDAIDHETIERNRMMAKIHLMGFDESLKHRVRNDLENEEFPEYLMVDVPDKLPKRNVTKKLSQAEARLERFKNANAKRSNNNNAPKQSATTTVKRRTEQTGSSARGSEIADGTSSGSTRSGSSRTWEHARGNPENTKDPPPKIRAVDWPHVADYSVSKTRGESPDIETFRDSRRNSPGKIGKVEATWRSYSPDNYFKSLTSDGKIIMRRGASPRFLRREFDRSDFRSVSADRQTRETRRSTSPEIFCREGERSATTMTIDQERARGPTMSSITREMLTKLNTRSEGTATSDRKYHADVRRDERSSSPQFSLRESDRSGTTVSTDRNSVGFRSASADRQTRETRRSRSTSPEFFCREGERSTTTMMIDRRGSTSSRDRETLTQQSERAEGTTTSIDRKYAEITRSSTPRFFRRESERSDATVTIDRDRDDRSTNVDFGSADRQTRETRRSRSTSPEFCREDEKSATTMTIDQRVRAPTVSSLTREMLTKQHRRSDGTATSTERKYAEATRDERTSSSSVFLRESGKSGATMSIDRKSVNTGSASADRQTRTDRSASRSTSPEFFGREGERSATTMLIDRRGSTSSRDREILTQQSKRTEGTTTSIDRKYAEITSGKRSSSSPFFLKKAAKSSATMTIDRKGLNFRSSSADRQTDETRRSRSRSPEFFYKEGERSAATMLIDRRGSSLSRDREMLTKHSRQTKGTTASTDRKYTTLTRDKRSSSSPFFPKKAAKSSATMTIDRKGLNFRSASADRQTDETRRSRSRSPEFFCKEGERSATTMLIDREGSSLSRDREMLTKQSRQTKGTTASIDRKYTALTRDKRSSSSPFFSKKAAKSSATMTIDRKDLNFRSASVDRQTDETRRSRSRSPEFFYKEGERSAATMMIDRRGSSLLRDREMLTKQSRQTKGTTASIDRKYTALTRDKRSSSSPFFPKKAAKSSATMTIDRKGLNFRSASADRQTDETRRSRSRSPEFFCKEDERSATTMLIDREGSSLSRDREMLTKQSRQTKGTSTSIDRRYTEATRDKRSSSSPFFLKGSEKSGATLSIDRQGINDRSASADRQTDETRRSRSRSPEFFCKEGERSATTMLIDREMLTKQSRQTKGTTASIDRKYTEATRDKRSSSSPFFLKGSEKSGATSSIDRQGINDRSASADRQTDETRRSRSRSPEFFCKEGERSATTMLIDREMLTKQSRQTKGTTASIDRKYTEITRDKRSSSSPFFPKKAAKSSATMTIDRKGLNFRSASADRQTDETRRSRSRSPEFFCKEDERSATTMLIDREGSSLSRDREMLTKQSRQTKGTTTSIDRRYTEATRDKRSSSSPFFLKDSEKSGATLSIDRKGINIRSTSADRQTGETHRSRSPEFFSKEGERSATNMLIDRRGSSRDREVLTKQSKQTKGTARSIDRRYTEATRDKGSPSPRIFYRKSERSATTTLIDPKSSPTDAAKGILRQRKYTYNTSYKQPVVKPWSPGNKGTRSTRVRHTPSPPIAKSQAKRDVKRDEASSMIFKSDSRRSSKVSSATSASSIVSLKYGLELDNILQSAGLVRKFMKSQNGGQREAHRLRSPSKHVIKTTVSARTVRNGPPMNRYRVSPLHQKSRSPSTDSKERTTPEYSRKSITPTEIDMEIQEITMTDHRMERRKSSSPEQSKGRISGTPEVSMKIISPRRDCGRRHVVQIKSKTPARFSPLGKNARRSAEVSRTLLSPRVAHRKADQTYASRYSTYTVKDRKRESASVARKSSPDLSDDKARGKSEESRGFSQVTLTQREDASGKDIGRIDWSSVQESTSRRFDSVGSAGSAECSVRASPEISLRTMDEQTKASVKELNASARSKVDSSRKITSDVTLRSTLRTPTGEGPTAGHVARKSNSKAFPSKEIRSSRRITKTYRSSVGNKPGTTQRRSQACKRQLFDSAKKIHEKRTNWSFAKTREKEDYSSASVRSLKGEATSTVKSLEGLDVAQRPRRSEEKEAPTISVKPLRSIEDIRKSIGHHETSALTATKRSRSAIANSTTSREGRNARRSNSASNAARLTKVQSCVSRIAKSPSPDASARKQHETNARATRGSAPSSPSKSPDMPVAPRRGTTESKNQDARSARRPIVAKATESIGSKTTTEAVDEVDDVVQQDGSPRESSAKKSNAFVIDLDDRQKESDTTPPKKVTSMRRSSNDKYQATSSASGRPASSVSSNFSSAGTTQSQTSSTRSKMATRAKTPVSGGSQTKGPPSARTPGSSADNLISCNVCGRNFAQDRISLHEKICAKTMNKKRKQFDATMFRVKGTELEPFVKKGVAKKHESKKPDLKTNWRRKHEEFIETIRSAKVVQAHLAAGGSLKDLPPPPPSDTSDYIQCPHCGRKFNQAAAERHIPKCEHMLHNKPAHARAAKTRR